MATDTQRKLMAEMERLGYTYRGEKNGEVLMHHPVGGTMRLHSSPSDSRHMKNKLSEARRRLKVNTSVTGKFINWMFEKHDVKRDERRELTNVNVRDEIREYLAGQPSNANAGTLNSLVQTFHNDPRVHITKRGAGTPLSNLILTGPDYGLDVPTPEKAIQEHLTTPQPVNGTVGPLDGIIDQLREMLTAEMSHEVDDLRTRIQLAYDALNESEHMFGQALDLLKGGLTADHPHTGAESRPEVAALRS